MVYPPILVRPIAPKPPIAPSANGQARISAHASAIAALSRRARPRQPKARTIPRATWDEQEENIHQLYLIEDLPLTELISQMSIRFGFLATQKQYKTQLGIWGMSKNIKEHEMIAILRKEKKRKAEHPPKASCFFVRGRAVSEQKMRRFEKQRNLHEDHVMQDAPTPPQVLCFTPSTIESPLMLQLLSPKLGGEGALETSSGASSPITSFRNNVAVSQLSEDEEDWFNTFVLSSPISRSSSPDLAWSFSDQCLAHNKSNQKILNLLLGSLTVWKWSSVFLRSPAKSFALHPRRFQISVTVQTHLRELSQLWFGQSKVTFEVFCALQLRLQTRELLDQDACIAHVNECRGCMVVSRLGRHLYTVLHRPEMTVSEKSVVRTKEILGEAATILMEVTAATGECYRRVRSISIGPSIMSAIMPLGDLEISVQRHQLSEYLAELCLAYLRSL